MHNTTTEQKTTANALYTSPFAERITLETEEILNISFTGSGTVLEDSDSNASSKNPATDFGNVSLF